MKDILNEVGFVWKKTYTAIALIVLSAIIAASTFGINDNGYRTVVQWPSGNTFVKMEPGPYLTLFGSATEYADVVTHDLEGDGVPVRYQDGGTGTIDGVVRVSLPTDEASMLKLHKAVRSEEGLRNKLIYPEVKQALNLTAGLMTSEEAYAVRRNDYANWATEQIQEGRYNTVLEVKEVKMQDGTIQKKEVPVIALDKSTGIPTHQSSPIKEFGIKVAGFQITDWDFEPKTLAQISNKRAAEMAIITAKANADKAVWEQKEIKANGEKEVERVRYEQLQLAEKATIAATREKEVAVINAERTKEVNAQAFEAAKIDVQTAQEEAKALKARKDAEAYGKKVVMLADGALDKKLEAYVQTQRVWAEAYAARKVPTMVMGASDGAGTNADTSQFQSMLTALVAKDLVLNPQVTK